MPDPAGDPAEAAPSADPLERVCGLADISLPDRDRLRSKLEYVDCVLRCVDRGAGFCEDRGFPWTAEMERAEGTDRIFEMLRAWPILRRLLPRLRHLRHRPDPVIASGTVPIEDVAVARLLLDGPDRSFERAGNGWDERAIEVRLGATAISVSERTCASDTGDRPLDSSERTIGYEELDYTPSRSGLERKFGAGFMLGLSALAERMRRTVVPCDACGRASQSFSIAGSTLSYAGPSSGPATSEVREGDLLPLRLAMAAQDLAAISSLNPAWVDGYWADRDLSLCRIHQDG